ncbi:MAG: hypothetical protein LAO20_15105 [Acidobacteriia bacterium]|nr:hypothetical protein [Terriglobia bacterium]
MDAFVSSQLKEWALLLTFIAMWVWIAYIVTTGLRRRQQTSMQKALLEKFASAHDFAEFMQSPAGQKYVMSFTDAVTSPRQAILKTVQIGMVLAFAGVGLLGAALRNRLWFVDILGMLSICMGAGFLVSAVVSYFIARKMDAGVKE